MHRQRLAVVMVVFIEVVVMTVYIVAGEVLMHHTMHTYISRGLA
jgi:hypothetical protein